MIAHRRGDGLGVVHDHHDIRSGFFHIFLQTAVEIPKINDVQFRNGRRQERGGGQAERILE